MQAFIWEVVRALTKFGIAMAANRPMIATTIMISTSVKPNLRLFFFCICYLSDCCYGVNRARGGLIFNTFAFTDCLLHTVSLELSTPNANRKLAPTSVSVLACGEYPILA